MQNGCSHDCGQPHLTIVLTWIGTAVSPRINSDLQAVDEMMRGLLGNGPVALAANYHLDGGGSGTRAMLALDAARALQLDPLAAVSCACATELLHNASLVHDDVQECDDTRRGKLALWRRFDVAAAIGAGDLMISAAFASLAAHPDPASALMFMHEAISATARGQADDLAAQIASLSDYRAMVAAKTGPLLALPVRLALCAARVPGDGLASEVGRNIAFAYQTMDDLNDLAADRAAGRVNICTVLEADGRSRFEAAMTARAEARAALDIARIVAGRLPQSVGTAFYNLADRLDSTLTEFYHAA